VSLWEGELYRVTPEGVATEILNGRPAGLNTADFEYLIDRRLIVIPTFLGNRVVAHRLER